jgi:hypothetical protein
LLRLLGDGKCTLASAYRQFLEIPPEAAVRIPLGKDEEETLARELVALARDPARRARIGAAARAFIAAEHSMAAAACGFREAVTEIAASPPRASPRPPLWRCPKTSRSAAIAGVTVPIASEELVLRPCAAAEIQLCVRNEGDSRWISAAEPFGGHVAVGAEIVTEQGRVAMSLRPVSPPYDVEPGDEVVVRFVLEAPDRAGAYRVRPVLVHAGRERRVPLGAALDLSVRADVSS